MRARGRSAFRGGRAAAFALSVLLPVAAVCGGVEATRVAFVPLPHGWPQQVLVRGGQVFLSNGESEVGLQSIDWRRPHSPRLIQAFDVGNYGRNAVVLGNRIYALASYYGISIFEIADNERLRRLGRFRLPPPANHGTRVLGMALRGRHYLYIHVTAEGGWKDWPPRPAAPVPGLYLLDVTDARHVRAQRVGDMPLFDRIVDALGLLRHGAVVDIYALGNPRMPRRIASYRAAGTILDLSVEQSRLWLLVEGGGVELVDLSHPASPKRLAASGNVDMPQAAAVAAKGDWCYVVESGKGWAGPDHGMHVLHRRGDRLVHVRHLQWPRTNLQRMVIDEHAAYVTDKFYGVWRFDLTHPEQPQPQALFMSAGEIQQLLADGPVALANLEWGGTVAILDISDPLHIRLRGYYRPGRFDDYAVALYGRYFYYGKGKIRRIVDIHDPSHPLEVGSWRLPGNPLMPPLRRGVRMFQWLQTDQGRVLLSAWNIGNPLHPQLRGMLLLPPDLIADYGAAAAGGGRMFAVANDVVVAIDIHDPVHMRLLGKYREAGIGREAHYQWQGAGQRAVLNGDALYILQGSEALDRPRIAILDVSRPQRMHRVGRTPLTPPAFQEDWFDERLLHQGDMLNDMVRSGDLLFVSDYWGGVRIYDLQRPLHPQLRWWEFSPYLALMPEGWSRAMYKRAVASGRLHRTLRLDDRTWALRHVIGRRLESQPLVYHPGYELFGWNIGAVVGDYLLQPKLGGIAVYRLQR